MTLDFIKCQTHKAAPLEMVVFSKYLRSWPFSGKLFGSDLFFPCSHHLTYVCIRSRSILAPKPCWQEIPWQPKVYIFTCVLLMVSSLLLPSCLWRLQPSGTITCDIYDLSCLSASTLPLLLFLFFLSCVHTVPFFILEIIDHCSLFHLALLPLNTTAPLEYGLLKKAWNIQFLN